MFRVRGPLLQEYRYLIRCLRRDLQNEDCELHGNGSGAEGFDWAGIKTLALVHGVYPVFASALLEYYSESAPRPFLRDAQQILRKNLVHNTFLLQELCRVAELLETQNIPVLVLKGPLLAQLAYGDIRLRYNEDLDLFIPSQLYEKAHRVLCDDGYSLAGNQLRKKGFSKLVDMYFNRQASYSKGASVYRLDVHTSLMPPLFYYPDSFYDFQDRSRTVSLDDATLRTFDLEDTLILLCFHGVKNRWNRLKYIVDIAYLIKTNPLQWKYVLDEAKRLRAERILYVGLFLAHRLFEVRMPRFVRNLVYRDDNASAIGEDLLNRFPAYTPVEETSYLERVTFNVRTQNSLLTRLRYISLSLLRRSVDLE